jgi:hypothetical protein
MKRNNILFFFLLLIFIFTINIIHADSIDNFWKWFTLNDQQLFHFEDNQEKMFNLLSNELSKVNPGLTFEFGPINKNKREFIISADGIISVFPTVEALYNKRPKLDHWSIIKFRQRKSELYTIKYNKLSINPSDVFFTLDRDGKKVGLNLYIKGYDESDDRYMSCAYLFLDSALGEYDVETKVGFINILKLDDKDMGGKSKLKDLPKDFDKYYTKLLNN